MGIQAIPNGSEKQEQKNVDTNCLLGQHNRCPHGDRILEDENAHMPAHDAKTSLMGMHAYWLVRHHFLSQVHRTYYLAIS